MAVQIPKLKRIAPQAGAPTARITARAPDFARGLAKTSAAIEGVAGAAISALNHAEDNAINVEKYNRGTAFKNWIDEQKEGNNKKGILGLRRIKGDPTEAYNQFDEDLDTKFKEFTAGKGLSSRAQRKIESHLRIVYDDTRKKRLIDYGNQYDKYDQRNTDAAVALASKEAVDNAGLLDLSDIGTLIEFNIKLKEMSDLRIERALRTGRAHDISEGSPEKGITYVDSDKNERLVKLDSVVDLKRKEDASNTIFRTIDLMINSGEIDKADFMFKGFSRQLDDVHKPKLAARLEKAKIKRNAMVVVSGTAHMSGPDAITEIEKIKDSAVRIEAFRIKSANDSNKAQIIRIQSNKVRNTLSKYIDERMSSDNPFSSIYQMEEDPVIKKFWGDLDTSKQRDMLREMVDRPAGKSDIKSVTELMEYSRERGFETLPFEKFREMAVGINASDFRRLTGYWMTANRETTLPQEQRAGKEAKIAILQMAAAIRVDGIPLMKLNKKGQPLGSFRKMGNELMALVEESSSEIPKRKQGIRDWARDALGDLLTERKRKADEQKRLDDAAGGFFSRIFTKDAPVPKPLAPSGETPALSVSPEDVPAKKTTARAFLDLGDAEVIALKREWQAENEGSPTAAQLIKFFNDRNKESK